MSLRRQIKDLEQKAQREPQNLAVRLQLAAVLRAAGRREEGTALVRSVALAYHGDGRIAQALAVCRSLLEIEPADLATQALFAELEAARTGGPGEEPTQWADGRGRRPTLPPIASPLPVVEASPDDYEIDEETAPPASGVERTRPRPTSEDDESLDTAPAPLADRPPIVGPFARLPPAAQRDLLARRLPRRYVPGDVIVREGEPGDSCFLVSSGQVRVLRRDPERPGETLEVARLGAGELFGEFALLVDRRRHATVQAIDRVDCDEIPRRVLREVAANHPGAGAELERLYRERLLTNLVRRAPLFRSLPGERRSALVGAFTAARFEAGQAIVREGEANGGFYLVVLGAVEVTQRAGGRGNILLATLGEGQYFGDLSLASGAVAAATVTATGPTELAQLPRRELSDLLTAHPAVLDEVRREVRRRELAQANILAGETSLV